MSGTRTENRKNISSKLVIGLQVIRRTREKLPVLFFRIKSKCRETDRGDVGYQKEEQQTV